LTGLSPVIRANQLVTIAIVNQSSLLTMRAAFIYKLLHKHFCSCKLLDLGELNVKSL